MYKIQTERADLFDVNMMITMQVSVKGKASEQELSEAFIDTVAAFEMLNLVDAVNLEFAGYFHSRTSAKPAKLPGYGHNTKDLSITNLTRLDIPTEYGRLPLTDLIFVPPVVSYGKNIVGMVTVGDHLNTTYHFYNQKK